MNITGLAGLAALVATTGCHPSLISRNDVAHAMLYVAFRAIVVPVAVLALLLAAISTATWLVWKVVRARRERVHHAEYLACSLVPRTNS